MRIMAATWLGGGGGRRWRGTTGPNPPGAIRHWDLRVAGLAALVSLLAATQAVAQILHTLFPEGVPGYGTQPGVTVLSRLRAEQEPQGLREGAFRLFPRLETALGYDDNVLGGTGKRGSWVAATRPSVLLASDWSRDAFGAYVSVADTSYPNQAAQGRTDATLAVGGAIDLGRDRLTLAGSYVATHQDRTEIDALPSDRPVAVRIADLRASYAIRDGRWEWTPQLAFAHWSYGDTTIQGAPVSQSYRDRDVLRGDLTLRYELAPLRNLVMVARATRQSYTKSSPGQPAPDSTGLQILAGLDYDDNAVWRYRLLLGVESRSFSNPAYRQHGGLTAEAEVAWNPTGLTTLRASLVRGLQDAAQEGVAGYTYTAARVRIDHELTRVLLLHATAGLQQAAFLQSGGRQSGYSLGVGATWLVNRSVRLSATYDASGLRGSDPGMTGTGINRLSGDYNRNIALLTLRLGL
jgi:hypothetical protein